MDVSSGQSGITNAGETVNRQVISFALFGADPKYRSGMMQNLRTVDQFYPGWEVIIYCDRANHDAMAQAKLGGRVEVVLQQERSDGVEGMSWRLLATLLPGVRAVLFRDADSLFTTREVAAVGEWLRSDYDTHIIRDHPYHQSPVMGGTLGVKGEALAILAGMVRDRLHSYRRSEYGDDQVFLSTVFYPRVRRNALVHTGCVRYFPERTQPMPPDRPGEGFVGAYAFLTPAERDEYEAIRRNTAAITLLPPHWQRRRALKLLCKLYKPIRRIRHGIRLGI